MGVEGGEEESMDSHSSSLSDDGMGLGSMEGGGKSGGGKKKKKKKERQDMEAWKSELKAQETARVKPPPRAVGDPYAAAAAAAAGEAFGADGASGSSASSGAAPTSTTATTTSTPALSSVALLVSAQQRAMAAAERALEAEATSAPSSAYMAELLGADPYSAFQGVILGGGSEEAAWEAFRGAEKALCSYNEAVARAGAILGVDPETLKGVDSWSVEAALVEARRYAAGQEYAKLRRRRVGGEEAARHRAARVIQCALRRVWGVRAAGRAVNRSWIPLKDAASGFWYYTHVESGESVWELPPDLPPSCLTLKVLCTACSAALVTIHCTTCAEGYCTKCSADIHTAQRLRRRAAAAAAKVSAELLAADDPPPAPPATPSKTPLPLPAGAAPTPASAAAAAAAAAAVAVVVVQHKGFPLPIAGSPSSALGTGAARLPRGVVRGAFGGSVDGVCLACERRVGTLYCGSCDVVYCGACWEGAHARGNRARHRHTRVFRDTVYSGTGLPLSEVDAAGVEREAEEEDEQGGGGETGAAPLPLPAL